MRFLHTMVRVSDLDDSLEFYCKGLGLQEIHRMDSEEGRFTLVYLVSPDDLRESGYTGKERPLPPGLPLVELTYNWDREEYTGGRNFGHLAFQVQDVYAVCAFLQSMGVPINRPPRDGRMAFVRSPDGISIELLQAGGAQEPEEPWASMENTGSW